MTELIIPLIRPQRPTVITDIEPTPLEIQRWEDDGGAVLADTARSARVRCHCGGDHRSRTAA